MSYDNPLDRHEDQWGKYDPESVKDKRSYHKSSQE